MRAQGNLLPRSGLGDTVAAPCSTEGLPALCPPPRHPAHLSTEVVFLAWLLHSAPESPQYSVREVRFKDKEEEGMPS